jgi:O-antigen/teichoic acid export membrane protein
MTAADVGLYAATYTLVNEAFNRSAMVLLRTFQPVYFQSYSTNDFRQSFNVLWIWIACVFGLGIMGVSALYFLKDWVASFLLAKTYHAAVILMPIIGIGCALQALGNVVAQPMLANKQPRMLMIGRICGSLTAAVSLPFMVKHYGLLGAAIANPLYFGTEAFVLAMLAKPWQKTKREQKNISCLVAEEAASC